MTNLYGLKECRGEIANEDKKLSEWKGRHFEFLPLETEFALPVIYNLKEM